MLAKQKKCTEEINGSLDRFRSMPMLHFRTRHPAEDSPMEPGKQGSAMRHERAFEGADGAFTIVGTTGGGDY